MSFAPTFTPGRRFKFRSQNFWAEGGLICIENQNNGDFKVITRVEAAARAFAFNAELQYMVYPDERDELCNCVRNLCAAVKEGKFQGDPADIEVRKQRLKDLRKVSFITGSEKSSTSMLPSHYLPGLGSGVLLQKPATPLSERFQKLEL